MTYLYESLLAASVAFLLWVVMDFPFTEPPARLEPVVYVTDAQGES